MDSGYAAFTPALLGERRDERVQIGYRLAHKLGHRTVYAIDEQPSEGEPDYFPFETVVRTAQAHGQMEKLQDSMAQVEAEKREFQEKQSSTSLSLLLAEQNERSP